MIKSKEQLKKISKELEKIFGEKATEKVRSHIFSLWRKIEDLEISRDNWKRKYFEMKSPQEKVRSIKSKSIKLKGDMLNFLWNF